MLSGGSGTAGKGVQQLSPEAWRHVVAGDAEVGGPLPVRQVEGAEQKIPERKQAREVLVEGLGLATVMPAVKGGAGNHETQGAKAPGNVGVQQDGVE